MRDPMTVVCSIPRPWPARQRMPSGGKWHWYWPDFATVWHRDPERDGSDDSCGWSRAKLTEADRALAQELANWESEWPYFFAQPQRVTNPAYPNLWTIGPGDAAMLMVELWSQIAWRLERRELSPREVFHAMRLGHNPTDNFAASLTHTRPDDRFSTFLWIIRAYRGARRPWYRHPRWHIHHWRIQIHCVQAFKRWLFTRCATCGGRFAYGESGLGTWSGHGPRWFRSETLTHMRCSGAGVSR